MQTTFTTRSVAQLLTYPFRDPRWMNKVGIGFLITIVSPFLLFIPTMFVFGYCMRIMRRIIIDREDPSLPEWDDWQELFIDGCKLTGAGVLYYLPVIFLFAIVFSFMILFVSFANVGSSNGSSAMVWFSMLGSLGMQGVMMMIMLLSLLTTIIAAGGYAHMAAKGTFGAAFKVGEWWPIFRANLGGFLISYLLIMAVSYFLTIGVQMLMITLILCIVVPIGLGVISFYQGVLTFALFGLAYREGQDELAPRSVAELG